MTETWRCPDCGPITYATLMSGRGGERACPTCGSLVDNELHAEGLDVLIRVRTRDVAAARRSAALHPIVADVVLEAGGLVVREITVREVGLDRRRKVVLPTVNVFGSIRPVMVLPTRVEEGILLATAQAFATQAEGSVWRVVDGRK